MENRTLDIGLYRVGRHYSHYKDKAAFWTDGRYVQQAEKELAGTGIERYCMIDPKAPSIYKWMLAELPKKGRVGFDGRVVMIEERRKF